MCAATFCIGMAIRPCDRLKRERAAAGYSSAAAFAKAFEDQGLTESAYRHKENGTREISVLDAKLFAKLLANKRPGITWNYIINGDAPPDQAMAAVIGYVGAGEKVFPFDDDHAWDPLPAPPGMTGDIKAAVVRGSSNFPVYRDGDILYFAGSPAPTAHLLGKDCMVQVVEGPRLIKNLRKGSKRGLFRLYSYATDNESDDVRLEWAAPVSWVQRK